MANVVNTEEKIIRVRSAKDSTDNWEKANPILLDGEIGLEMKPDGSIAIKVGDGKTAWKLLQYVTKTIKDADAEFQNLQNQLDNIVVASSEDGGDVSAEVAQARVAIDGTNFVTLKDRLDADQNALATEINRVETDILSVSEDVAELPFAKKAIYGQGLLNTACTGLESTTAEYHTKYTAKFPVSVGDKFAYKGYGNFGHASVAWFDSNGSKISAEEYQSKTEFIEITVPSGAYYAMFASYSDLAMPIIFEVYRKTGDYIGTPQELDAIRTELIEIVSDTEDVSDRITEVNDRLDSYIVYGKDSYDFEITPRTLINALTGEVTQFPDDTYTTATFDVTGINELCITASANFGNFVYVIYNDNDERIGGSKSENTSAGTVMQDRVIALPEGSTTLIVANHKTSTNPQKIEIYQKRAGFLANELSPEIQETISEEIAASATGKWAGKKWVCVGDSLTEVNSKTTKHYYDYITDDTGISVVNMGVSGTGYMRRYDENQAFFQRVESLPTDADVVTIFGSGNDLSLISVLGDPTDTGTETICGCINETIDVIIERIPAVSLGIVSPTPWSNNKPTLDDSNPMAQYTIALREICKIRSIPFLDLYHCSNLRPWTAEGRTACYSKDGGDGVHPDETGHKIIAPRFKNFLESLIALKADTNQIKLKF